MITCIFYFHQLPWNGPTDMSTHLSRRIRGRGREEGRKKGYVCDQGRTGEAPSGVPHFVLLLEAFLFSFLLPFERRVKTK